MRYILSDFWGLLKKEPLITFLFIFLCSGIAYTLSMYATILLFPILLYKGRIGLYIDNLFIFICFYSFLYALFSSLNGFYDEAHGNIIFQSCYPPLFYLLGRWLVKKRTQYIYMVFLLMTVLVAVPVIIDVIRDINENQFINPLRQILDKNGIMNSSATLLGIKVSLSVVCLGLLFSPVLDKRESAYKYVFILFSLLALMCVIHLINRTGIILAFISLFCILLFNAKRMPILSILCSAMLLITVFVFLQSTINFSDKVEQSYENRDEGESSVSSAGGRTWRWKKGIEDLYLYPLGYSNNGTRTTYAHNYWLDTSATAGIFPFVFLLILTILYLKRNYLLVKKMKQSLLRSLVIVCNLGFFLTCFVEPAMEGFMLYVFLFFFFIGITSQLYFNHRYSYIKSA